MPISYFLDSVRSNKLLSESEEATGLITQITESLLRVISKRSQANAKSFASSLTGGDFNFDDIAIQKALNMEIHRPRKVLFIFFVE
jgi:hypothetical protein